jgi:hypothetical protein
LSFNAAGQALASLWGESLMRRKNIPARDFFFFDG